MSEYPGLVIQSVVGNDYTLVVTLKTGDDPRIQYWIETEDAVTEIGLSTYSVLLDTIGTIALRSLDETMEAYRIGDRA